MNPDQMAAGAPDRLRAELNEAVLRGVQHDLRNAAQLLSATIGDPDLPDGHQMLAKRVLGILDDQMTRLDWCRRPATFEVGPVDAAGALRSAIAAMGLAKPNQPITVALDAPADLPAVEACESLLVDTFATILLAIRGPAGLLARRRAVRVNFAVLGDVVEFRAETDIPVNESDAEREHREAGWVRAIAVAHAASATAAESEAGSGLRLAFRQWLRRAPSEPQTA
jgi:hypothetical protein